MQRYFVEPHLFSEREVTITGDDVHHIVNVMRAKSGEEIIVSDGAGRSAIVRIDSLSGKEVVATVVELLREQRELPVQITIGQGLPKGEKMEWVLQKGTELGAFAFFPFSSERTIVKLDAKKEAKKLDRWRKIVKEAAEQSHRSILPELLAPVTFRQIVEESSRYTRAVIAYEKEGGTTLHEVLPALMPGDSLLVLIGSEGGFSPEEVAAAEAAGIRSISLGPRILRTETACQYVLAAASYQFERTLGQS
ncbi:16S rRNA (uracil(1498)-N(3))-methyltransferase [Brevibacillus borstelensis]|uniref:16S rRNA (uracil(1498)-N(3))-methyltransferase n=1 Tax=Brevibacillus borstelensis TaxID=45462 RepID=UPI0014904238|nr:16S rRNA (uracil(1498)-N(3))-methyltransferase [Brevibacillus borstelensis]MED1874518.1 16S rRNA (uracil(1498)-N(3))-methyltransferase [Brevibacillus borstelensis]NOU57716.1 16S rRNA (uracil(1498)-N(3))-methyltransferase [Brevibacillus borstelensis]